MWLLPSRRRIANLQRFFAAYNATGGTTPGMVIVDRADYCEGDYPSLELPLGWFVRVSEGETQGEKIAEIWDQVKDCTWLGLIGDDCVPETMGWDKLLVDRLDGANFVSCDDGWLAPQRAANCWVIAGPLVRAVGYIFPPGLHHLFVDDVWETIGREAECWTRAMDVMVRHRHVMKGEATADDTHRAAYGMGFSDDCPGPDRKHGLWANDETIFKSWLEDERHIAVDAARKLRPQAPAVIATDEHAEERARLEYAKTRSLMILTPIFRHPTWGFTDSYGGTISVLERLGIAWDRRFVIGMSDLPKARNFLSAMFLASGFTDAIFIDDDIRWNPGWVLRLLAAPHPLIAAIGRKRNDLPNTDPRAWCFYAPSDIPIEHDEIGNITTTGVKAGGAFMRIQRGVFEAMIAENPERKLQPFDDMPTNAEPYYHQFFRNDTGGEDFYFCEQWNALAPSNRVWIDPLMALGHAGDKEYTGCLAELFKTAS